MGRRDTPLALRRLPVGLGAIRRGRGGADGENHHIAAVLGGQMTTQAETETTRV